MMLRLQSPDGQKRVELENGDTSDMLLEKVRIACGYQNCDVFQNREFTKRIQPSGRSLAALGLNHGDLLFVRVVQSEETMDVGHDDGAEKGVAVSVRNGKKVTFNPFRSSSTTFQKLDVEDDEVDRVLAKMDGKIARPRGALCRHNESSRCVHCIPLEPFDEAYLAERKIKHLSFHSYLKKLTSGADKGKFANLENISCKIKPNCSGHPPWPKGICSKCQPTALTLNLQKYRHVDCIMFENRHIVDRFLDFWRRSSFQRVGILLGRYEPHSDVPLGVRAVVAAIYEPPQHCARDGIELIDDPHEETVDELAAKLGLKRVGWIFSDLLPLDTKTGTVRHLRSVKFSYLLSAQECITAGALQNKYPNSCKLSTDRYFGSKFVTICVTGDEENQIHMEGYQVSNQCMALVKDNCLVPTQDAPELAWVKESSNEQYVPDVFYSTKDQYGNEVQKRAQPLPVEYLLVDVPVSSPNQPVNTFRSEGPQFLVENRSILDQIQDLVSVNQYLRNFTANKDLLSAARDFHFLLYIATLDVVHIPLDGLLEAVRNQDANACGNWASRCEQWQTFETILSSMGSPDADMANAGGLDGTASSKDVGPSWNCAHCTFTNIVSTSTCEICSLPRR
ncbi:nuclear protein localization protein 4-like [Tropilaelaps mercedesae]|uniref:Nuclear protein localization protein 4 homolog n=1 Tax=Tropilaelaps mercedesae TaxID=418985 RepID=A0A1V9XBA3_9ACAR|nr:nuclear protein localization protein 4-like [Tropilaelaps mercedesae]